MPLDLSGIACLNSYNWLQSATEALQVMRVCNSHYQTFTLKLSGLYILSPGLMLNAL